MINQGLKMLKRAIDERPKGGMQTGMPRIQLRESDAVRSVAELEWAQQHITELEARLPKWISADERLPDNGVPVLIRSSFGEIFTCRRPVIVDTNKSWESNTGEFNRPKITHWMPLPQPPKEQDHE